MLTNSSIRLNKYISESGICSRRDADRYIEQGNVFINGKRATVGEQVYAGDVVKVNGQLIEPRDQNDLVLIALNKPVALYLIKHSATPNGRPEDALQPTTFEKPQSGRMITSLVLVETIAMITICLMVGGYIRELLAGSVFELPIFVYVLFVGVILSNILTYTGFYQVFDRAVSVVGNVSLSLFLAIALMSLRLWELASLALPMLAILLVQTLMMALYAILVTYRVMGKNYDAAVLAAGHCGLGLGATPTAIANMQAITDRFGPSHIAFIIVPMVGAFFLDIANAIVIKLSLLLPMFTALS